MLHESHRMKEHQPLRVHIFNRCDVPELKRSEWIVNILFYLFFVQVERRTKILVVLANLFICNFRPPCALVYHKSAKIPGSYRIIIYTIISSILLHFSA